MPIPQLTADVDEQLLSEIDDKNKSQNELRNSQNQKLKVEITLTHLIGLEKTSTITELLNRTTHIDNIDQKKKSLTDKKVTEQTSNDITLFKDSINRKSVTYQDPKGYDKNEQVNKLEKSKDENQLSKSAKHDLKSIKN